jgi:hypothetical protein
MVDVDEQQGKLSAAARRVLQCHVQAIAKQYAIGKVGQRVEVGELVQVGLLALGDFAEQVLGVADTAVLPVAVDDQKAIEHLLQAGRYQGLCEIVDIRGDVDDDRLGVHEVANRSFAVEVAPERPAEHFDHHVAVDEPYRVTPADYRQYAQIAA